MVKINLILFVIIMMIGKTQEQTESAFQSSVFTDNFIDYIKSVENPKFSAGPVHDSAEGGNKTYGYGHKLTDTEKNLIIYMVFL